MDSTPDTKQTDPHNVSPGLSTQGVELVSRADERLAHAYEQIARVNEQISKLEQDTRGNSPRTGIVGHRVAGRRYAALSPCY